MKKRVKKRDDSDTTCMAVYALDNKHYEKIERSLNDFQSIILTRLWGYCDTPMSCSRM